MKEIINLSAYSLPTIIGIFLLAAIVIAIAGTWLTRFADQVADITGLGEALIGAVLLGAVTSIAGIVTTIASAYAGYPDLAVSNAIGGIAVQTFFLAIADITYKKANLEHASASLPNIMYSVLLIGLLAILLFSMATPPVTIARVHPGSPVILCVYIAGLLIIKKGQKKPMWNPTETINTIPDLPENNVEKLSIKKVWLGFTGCTIIVVIAGYVVAQAGIALADKTILSESFIGGLFTALATSLPELIVSIAAVRQGSLTLAVGNIVGGNSFEVIVVALADFFYKGSLIHAASSNERYIIILTIILMSVLLMGLLYRQERGIAKIGWESFFILLIFLGGYMLLYFISSSA